ncbi:hypothetical protein [Falsihalocynthiibacter sp. CO-5D18]|uniref:hypothetical protein n=1 Tax=Falsihalocynthiibacter sp. CO-5D18 TaxID=3240872 RepID=UPI00350FBD63
MREAIGLTHARDGKIAIHLGARQVAEVGGDNEVAAEFRRLGIEASRKVNVSLKSGREFQVTAQSYLGENHATK